MAGSITLLRNNWVTGHEHRISRTVSQPVSQSNPILFLLVSSYVPGRWGCEEGGVLRLWWSGAGRDGIRDPARWRGVLSPTVLSVRPVSRRHTCEHCFHDRPTRVHHKRSVLPHKLLAPNTLAECCVCHEKMLPNAPSGVIEYAVTPFWNQKFCRSHQRDGTRKCFACNRLESRTEPHVVLAESSSPGARPSPGASPPLPARCA